MGDDIGASAVQSLTSSHHGRQAAMAARRDTALVALVTGPTSDPLVAVGSAFVDATPAWLKDFAASTFGTADKLVLGIGEVVVVLALAALAGVLAARRWAWGATLVVVL